MNTENRRAVRAIIEKEGFNAVYRAGIEPVIGKTLVVLYEDEFDCPQRCLGEYKQSSRFRVMAYYRKDGPQRGNEIPKPIAWRYAE